MARKRPPSPPASSSSSSSSSSEDSSDEEQAKKMEVSPPITSPNKNKPIPKKNSIQTPKAKKMEVSPPITSPNKNKPIPKKNSNQTPKPNPSQPSESSEENDDDDEDDGEEEEEEDSSHDDEEGHEKKQPQQPVKPTPAKPTSDSGSSEELESESESDSEAPKLVKPISSKPMAEPSTIEKPAASPALIQIPYSDKKRGKVQEPGSGDQNKNFFQRIWSLEDEIAILKGMAEYKEKKGIIASFAQHMDGFHEFIAASLSIEVTNTQLSEKIRRLKKKYENAFARAKHGKGPQFAKPHDQTVYELSKKVWGTGADREMPSKKNVVEEHLAKGGEDSVKDYPFLREALAKQRNVAAITALESLDPAKAKVFEEKFKKQRLAEMKHHLQKIELWKESFKLIMDGVDKSG